MTSGRRSRTVRELAAAAASAGSPGSEGPRGTALVERARQLVAARFAEYSVLHPWESPATAYRRGRGYCLQYNGLLYQVLRELGVDCRFVSAARVRVHNDPSWRGGHAWVRVRRDGVILDVCAHLGTDGPGRVRFTPLTRVSEVRPPRSTSAVVGMLALGAALRARQGLGGGVPAWAHHPW